MKWIDSPVGLTLVFVISMFGVVIFGLAIVSRAIEGDIRWEPLLMWLFILWCGISSGRRLFKGLPPPEDGGPP